MSDLSSPHPRLYSACLPRVRTTVGGVLPMDRALRWSSAFVSVGHPSSSDHRECLQLFLFHVKETEVRRAGALPEMTRTIGDTGPRSASLHSLASFCHFVLLQLSFPNPEMSFSLPLSSAGSSSLSRCPGNGIPFGQYRTGHSAETNNPKQPRVKATWILLPTDTLVTWVRSPPSPRYPG